VFDTARPANKSDCTPLSCCCQLFWSVERKIVPESSRAQYTKPSGDETSTERDAAGEAVGALAIPAVAPAAGAMAGATGVSDTVADSLAIPDPTVDVGRCGADGPKTRPTGEGVMGGV
jgi:hypothetical protein